MKGAIKVMILSSIIEAGFGRSLGNRIRCDSFSSDDDLCTFNRPTCAKPSFDCNLKNKEYRYCPEIRPRFNCKAPLKKIEFLFRNICCGIGKYVKCEIASLTNDILALAKNQNTTALGLLLNELGNLEKNVDKTLLCHLKDLQAGTDKIITSAGTNINKAITAIVDDINSQMLSLLKLVGTWTDAAIGVFIRDTTASGAGAQLGDYLQKIATGSKTATDKIISDTLSHEKALIATEFDYIMHAIDSLFKDFEKKLRNISMVANDESNKELKLLLDKYCKSIICGIDGILNKDALALLLIVKKSIEKLVYLNGNPLYNKQYAYWPQCNPLVR